MGMVVKLVAGVGANKNPKRELFLSNFFPRPLCKPPFFRTHTQWADLSFVPHIIIYHITRRVFNTFIKNVGVNHFRRIYTSSFFSPNKHGSTLISQIVTFATKSTWFPKTTPWYPLSSCRWCRSFSTPFSTPARPVWRTSGLAPSHGRWGRRYRNLHGLLSNVKEGRWLENPLNEPSSFLLPSCDPITEPSRGAKERPIPVLVLIRKKHIFCLTCRNMG